MSIEEQILAIGKKARAAAVYMAKANTHAKNAALLETAKLIRANKAALTQANQADMAQAQANGLDAALLDRLALSDKAIETMAEGLEQIAQLPDPIGEMTDFKNRPTGIQVGKMRVP